MPKEIASTYVFRSDSNPAKAYQTLQYTDGTTSCECPGWARRNPPGGRTCKHTRYVEMGVGAQYAESCSEQSVPARRTPQRAMPQPTFSRPTGRRMELRDD